MKVGVRELRADLRKWLNSAAAGEEVLITDRGTPVARLVTTSRETALGRLVAEGVVTPAKRPAPKLGRQRRLQASGSVSGLVKEQRR